MNPYNYVRVDNLELVSIESLAILITGLYLLYLASKQQLSLEVVYFLALPFSDNPFRIASSVQPVEAIAVVIVALNYRKIRLNYVILIGMLFVLFSLTGYLTGNTHDIFSLLYSLKFLLIGLVFSVFIKREFVLSLTVMRFAVTFAFTMTLLQILLWVAGLPIHGIFFQGFFPRAKGLAHEPATWSIYIVMLFPFIFHFKLGRSYLLLNIASLIMTLSTFGIVSALALMVIRGALLLSRMPLHQLLPRSIRLKKSGLVSAGISAALLVVLLVAVPGLLDSTVKMLGVFDKLVQYQQEFSQGLGGNMRFTPENDTSGRGLDFTYFKENVPEHWIVGIGSFSAPYTDQSVIAGTNAYFIMSVEIGLVGMALLGVLLFLHYRVLFRGSQHKSIDFLAASLNLLLMIAGIRCFGFHEVWYVHSSALRTAAARDTPLEPAE